jgi:tetratricopeptide (TPR) repeat protein
MISCGRARTIIDDHQRGAAGDGARLELDRHLAECAACRADRAGYEILGVLKGYEPPQLGGAARARIVERLVSGGAPPEARAARRWPRLLAAAAALVALAAGAQAIARFSAGRRSAPLEIVRTAPAELAPRAPAPASPDQAIAIRADRPGRLELPSLALSYGADARLSLDPKARVLEIEQGEVDLTAAAATAPLRVVTTTFVVEVMASRVQVASSSVRVVRGEARILDLGGHELARLPEGAAWSAGPQAAAKAARPSGPSAAQLLERAHAALVAGSHAQARALADRAIEAGADARERARADLLRADSLLAERRPEAALAAYRRVAADHPRTAEAEDARFFVGQILFERGRRAEAESALAAYLADYPGGQYAREAREHLAELRPER